MAERHLLWAAIERSLVLDVAGAAVTPIARGHTTGWRTLPGCTTAHLPGLHTRLERDGVPPLELKPGEGFVLPPSLHHNSTIVNGSGVSRWSLFSCTILGGLDLMSLVSAPLRWRGREAERLGDAAQELGEARAPGPETPASAVRRHLAASRLVLTICERATLIPHALTLLAQADRLAPVFDRIEADLARRWTRAGLARLAGLSPSRFAALFAGATGSSPLAYIAKRRLSRAQQLLIATESAVQDVAASVGFDDAYHFSRWFRKGSGMPPRAYRAGARAGF